MGNRERALTAAVELLADAGIHGLTHLRVDKRAGLPTGSTSNLFRSRAELIVGVARHMANTEHADVAASFSAESEAELVASLARLFDTFVTTGRAITAARMVLFAEAIHDPDVREALLAGWATLGRIVRPALARLGAPDPDFGAQVIAICFEGLFLHVLSRGIEVPVEQHLEIAVRGALSSHS